MPWGVTSLPKGLSNAGSWELIDGFMILGCGYKFESHYQLIRELNTEVGRRFKKVRIKVVAKEDQI